MAIRPRKPGIVKECKDLKKVRELYENGKNQGKVRELWSNGMNVAETSFNTV